MGTGLPIVHFAKIDNDPAATYLLDYNNSLVIDEKERLENSAANFIEFCIINKRKRIKYDVVGETFKKNTSKYNARIIKNFIYSI
ncbi:MAG: hypothetical protein GYA55_02350 [SAR324 cluster bacterium]|uniref:Uncharacterized protein n=1 Tax=SAR324 cluster bacterium TaxID=2024889 RepID=A0A7X9IIV2_9DELT|nr:hypothetical protein [SAR324 cluster bacterium]